MRDADAISDSPWSRSPCTASPRVYGTSRAAARHACMIHARICCRGQRERTAQACAAGGAHPFAEVHSQCDPQTVCDALILCLPVEGFTDGERLPDAALRRQHIQLLLQRFQLEHLHRRNPLKHLHLSVSAAALSDPGRSGPVHPRYCCCAGGCETARRHRNRSARNLPEALRVCVCVHVRHRFAAVTAGVHTWLAVKPHSTAQSRGRSTPTGAQHNAWSYPSPATFMRVSHSRP